MGNLQEKIGELLRLERERKGIKLEDISISLKIPIENLQAVEIGDVDALPSELYFGLFAKSYSEAVGVDYIATVDAIREELAATPPPEVTKKKKTIKAADDESGENEDVDEPNESEATTAIFKQKKILYSIAALVIVVGGYFVVAQLMKEMSAGGDEYSSHNSDSVENTSDAAEGSPYDNYDWNVPEYKKPEPFTLTMTTRAESWSTVIADGDTAIFRRLVPGRNYTATAKYRMLLSVAVPSKVDIKLNGQTIDPVNPESRRISKVLIDQTNIDSILTVVDKPTEINTPSKKTEPATSLPVSIADQEINNSDASEVQDDER